MSIDIDKFKALTDVVISKMEGGYYHPDMLKDGRVKDKRYGGSGETMFGIDRLKGGSINDTTAGRKFWGAIDDSNGRKNWRWNYLGGNLKPKLIDSVSEMMYPQFNDNSRRYLSKASQDLIAKDDRLIFNFIYATWNGPGWFKKFATDFNSKVASGERNLDKLVQYTIDSRTKEGLRSGSSPNSLIKQGGEKIAGFINSLKSGTIKGGQMAIQSIRENPIIGTLIVASMILASWYLIKTIRNKN
jgi:hypothetical protein